MGKLLLTGSGLAACSDPGGPRSSSRSWALKEAGLWAWWGCAMVLLPMPRWAGQFQLLISSVMRQGGKALCAARVAAYLPAGWVSTNPEMLLATGLPWTCWEQGWGSELLHYFKQDTAPLSCHQRRQPKSPPVLTAVWPQKSYLMWWHAAGSGNCSRFGWWQTGYTSHGSPLYWSWFCLSRCQPIKSNPIITHPR